MFDYQKNWLKARLRCAWTTHYKLAHRRRGYRLLHGSGLEIGAFYLPAALKNNCRVSYADAVSRQEALQKFPELKAYPLVEVDHCIDIDQGGLMKFSPASFDFVIINHVIEHVANPIQTLSDLVRMIRRGGHLVITAPDKDYSVDRARNLTEFAHLEAEFRERVVTVSDDHYLDFLRGVHPEVFDQGPERLRTAMARARERREHAHVWDSKHFQEFLTRAFREVLNLSMELCYDSPGSANRNEYFSVWRKMN